MGALAVLITAYSLAAATLSAGYITVYRLKITYLAEGTGKIGEEIFSKTFPIAPDIEGWQRTVNYTLYLNGRTIHVFVKRDSQGNRYAYAGHDIAINGKANITLVEYVEVIPPPLRERKIPPESPCAREETYKQMLYLEGFWGHPFNGVSLSDLKQLSESLDGTSKITYIYRVIEWVLSNTEYRLGVNGGVMYPTEFYVEKHGACGDIHSFIVTMLRIKRIPSYVYYALIYRRGASAEMSSRKASFKTVNALPHIFATVRLCGRDFPVDLTYPAARDPLSAIRNAGINTGDNVVVLYRILDANPNDYLLVYAPSNNSRVNVEIEITKNSYFTSNRPPLLAIAALALLAALAVISLLKSTSTVGTYNV